MAANRSSPVYFAIGGMELCWLYALLNAGSNSTTGRLSIPLILSIFIISWASSLLLRYCPWPKTALTAISWSIWPVVMLLIIKIQLFSGTAITDTAWLLSIPHAMGRIFIELGPALFILLCSIVLWWLGRRMAYVQPVFSATVAEFQFGLVFLLIVFFSAYMLKLGQSDSLPVALAFFSFGLIAISVSHAQDNSQPGPWRQGHWSGLLLGSIGLVLVLGLIVSLIMTPGLIHLLIDALGWIWGLIERVFSFFAGLIPHSNPATPPPVPTMPAPPPVESGGFHLPSWLTSGMKTVWIVIVLLLVAAALWQISAQIFSWMRRKALDAGGERESLKGAFRADFLDWLKRITSFIFRTRFRFGSKPKTAALPPEIASVRQLYRQFLQWADSNGYPRLEAQTPHEYQEALEDVIRGEKEELAFITRQYMNARYGPALPSGPDLNRIKQTWHNLKQAGLKQPQKDGPATGDKSHGD